MSERCDYHVEKWGDHYCVLKKEAVSYDQYVSYCRNNYKESCPIYQFWKEQR